MLKSPAKVDSFICCNRYLHSRLASDVYLMLKPDPQALQSDTYTLAYDMYVYAARQLHAKGYHIFCERIFATQSAMAHVLSARQKALSLLADEVPPTSIIIEAGEHGDFAGIQIHAVKAPMLPMAVRNPQDNLTTVGRQLNIQGDKWLMLNGLCADEMDSPADQTLTVFNLATQLLKQSGGTFDSVARTWLWLKEICHWYDDLNRVRNERFIEQGLIDPKTKKSCRLPASTGIGLYGVSGGAITMDLIALPGREDQIQYVEAGGDQRSAYEYGSAFSRAAVAPMPGGNTVFISGTAAIDSHGVTENIGQIRGQVDQTIAHVQSLLHDLNSDDQEVCFALVYCKTVEVQQYFLQQYSDLPWPMLTMIGDVCRPELLFEVEVTARQKDK